METVFKLAGNLPGVIASHGEELETAISEASYCALVQMGDQIYDLDWANKYASLAGSAIKLAA